MEVNTYQHIDLEYLDMMSEGDESMKKVMLEMLLEELPQEIIKMKSLCADFNWQELGAVSHKMKSTLAFVGNLKMTEANKSIEKTAKENPSADALSGLIEVLNSLYPAVLDELKMELRKL